MDETHEEWTPYQKMEAGILKDISHDTDTILDKMEEKDMGGFDSGMLTGLMANKGIDPGIVDLMNDSPGKRTGTIDGGTVDGTAGREL